MHKYYGSIFFCDNFCFAVIVKNPFLYILKSRCAFNNDMLLIRCVYEYFKIIIIDCMNSRVSYDPSVIRASFLINCKKNNVSTHLTRIPYMFKFNTCVSKMPYHITYKKYLRTQYEFVTAGLYREVNLEIDYL